MNISHLKTHLSDALRSVRRGEHIVVLDRDTPIAEVIPIVEKENLILSSPSGPMRYPRQAHPTGKDPMDFLLADRT
jgi:antitoxin (DNA-binding transcriptional repressor) of toxin-antitoxin stability system